MDCGVEQIQHTDRRTKHRKGLPSRENRRQSVCVYVCVCVFYRMPIGVCTFFIVVRGHCDNYVRFGREEEEKKRERERRNKGIDIGKGTQRVKIMLL